MLNLQMQNTEFEYVPNKVQTLNWAEIRSRRSNYFQLLRLMHCSWIVIFLFCIVCPISHGIRLFQISATHLVKQIFRGLFPSPQWSTQDSGRGAVRFALFF